MSMAATPVWKIYNEDAEYVAACTYPEDAAALVSITGGTVRYDHRRTVWTEGSEEFSACQSYDGAASIMRDRLNKLWGKKA